MRRSNAQGKESDRSCCLATKGPIAQYSGDDRGMKSNGGFNKIEMGRKLILREDPRFCFLIFMISLLPAEDQNTYFAELCLY